MTMPKVHVMSRCASTCTTSFNKNVFNPPTPYPTSWCVNIAVKLFHLCRMLVVFRQNGKQDMREANQRQKDKGMGELSGHHTFRGMTYLAVEIQKSGV